MPEQRTILDAYAEALRHVFEMRPPAQEAAGADRLVRCLFKPSFDAECLISVIERDAAAELTLKAPDHSVWFCVSAHAGELTPDPDLDLKIPTLSVEQAVLPRKLAAAWRQTVDAVQRVPFPTDEFIMLDGMTAEGVLWRPGSERSFDVAIGRSSRAAGPQLLSLSLLDIAKRTARSERSVAALAGVRRYVEG